MKTLLLTFALSPANHSPAESVAGRGGGPWVRGRVSGVIFATRQGDILSLEFDLLGGDPATALFRRSSLPTATYPAWFLLLAKSVAARRRIGRVRERK